MILKRQAALGYPTFTSHPAKQGQGHILFTFRISVITRKEIVVDSGASMHLLSRKDLNSAELEYSGNPTTVTTANGDVQTNEEATVHVNDLY